MRYKDFKILIAYSNEEILARITSLDESRVFKTLNCGETDFDGGVREAKKYIDKKWYNVARGQTVLDEF